MLDQTYVNRLKCYKDATFTT